MKIIGSRESGNNVQQWEAEDIVHCGLSTMGWDDKETGHGVRETQAEGKLDIE